MPAKLLKFFHIRKKKANFNKEFVRLSAFGIKKRTWDYQMREVLVLDARCMVQGYCVFLVSNMSNCFTALSKSDSKDFISLSR